MMLAFSGFASDQQREASHAEALSIQYPKQMNWLEASGEKVFALYTEAEKAPVKGGLILLHDHNHSPDQQILIARLRSSLPQHQIVTLSLQMPMSEGNASLDDQAQLITEALPRITAGVDFLSKQGVKQIAILGYGLGAQMALYAQAEKKLPVKAMVLISLAVPNASQAQLQSIALLKKLTLPVLDIYAAEDISEVLLPATEKRKAAKQNPAYRQLKIDGEDHAFRHQAEFVSNRIYSWLSRAVFTPE